MKTFIDDYVKELLHIYDARSNKLIDLAAGSGKGNSLTIFLSQTSSDEALSEYVLNIINNRIGKIGNTLLRGSSTSKTESIINNSNNMLNWCDIFYETNPEDLDSFIVNTYNNLKNKGNNPLFLSVGALKWKIRISSSKDEIKEVISPILIFPIKLIRSTNVNPVYIEFIKDDIYFNPCLSARLSDELNEEIVKNIPHPNGISDLNKAVDLEKLGNGKEYFEKLCNYIQSLKQGEDTVFDLDKDMVAISTYNHDEISTYYDIKRNEQEILVHPLVNAIFNKTERKEASREIGVQKCVLESDSTQNAIISKISAGDSLIIKGPPGTGKTQTIANAISTLLYQNKSVLVSSKKLAALSEIYAKVPDKLRRFLLLLDSESEAETIKINPSEIKRDLNSTLAYKKKYLSNPNDEIDRNTLEKNRVNYFKNIRAYYGLLFDTNNTLNESTYSLIDRYLKYEDIDDIVLFDGLTHETTRGEYHKTMLSVESIEKLYDAITYNRKHKAYLYPYFNLSKENEEDIYKLLSSYAKSEKDNYLKIKEFAISSTLKVSNQKIHYFNELISKRLDLLFMNSVLDNPKIDDSITNLKSSLSDYYSLDLNEEYKDLYDRENKNYIDNYLKIETLELDDKLTINELNKIHSNLYLIDEFNDNNLSKEDTDYLYKLFSEYEKLKDDKDKALYLSRNCYKKDLTNDDLILISKECKNLSKYLSSEKDKPSIFDFKAKKAFNALKNYSFLSDVNFKEIVEASSKVSEYFNIESMISVVLSRINRLIHKEITMDDCDALVYIAIKAKESNKSIKNYALMIEKNYKEFVTLYKTLNSNENYTVKEVKHIYQVLSTMSKVDYYVSTLMSGYKDILPSAKLLISLYELKLTNPSLSREELCEKVNSFSESPIKNVINSLSNNTKETLNSYHKLNNINYHASNRLFVKFSDIEIIIEESLDRITLTTYKSYRDIVDASTILKDLIFKFEELDKPHASIKDIFDKSLTKKFIDLRLDNLVNDKYGFSQTIREDLKQIYRIEGEIRELNTKIIESQLLSSINDKDQDFDFLMKENDNYPLRILFKKHADGIKKLKKCLIMSPATVSILLRERDYFNYDVAIIDEASQLEPQFIIPIIFRAKQVVIVGDEWQMPPIDHFKTKFVKEISDYDNILKVENSVMDLALRNEAFESYYLESHYRSKTESLIKFSQERFYDRMKTFPAAIPKTPDLGFEDVYINGATSDGGINHLEAVEVVNAIKKHFDKFFTEVNNKYVLTESIGIISFGESQNTYIQKLVETDRDLSNKINQAIKNRGEDQTPDKVIFFRAIEDSQGQEASTVILSLTYGVDKNGKVVNRFGELNRDALGDCIFNVAVTRAQKKFIVVHSITWDKITNPRVDYLKNYLKIVEEFSKDGKGQFVSDGNVGYFYKKVATYIESLGIDKERIVFNYGVTNGSVRIPIAILNKDLTEAIQGLWLESFIKPDRFVDYNIRYYNILEKLCGWKLYKISILDWYLNESSEKNKLSKLINDILSEEK